MIKNEVLDKYKRGENVAIHEINFSLFTYILKERHKIILMLVLLMVFAFFIGYYVGYNNAVVIMNEFILDNYVNVTQNVGVTNWTIL